MRKITIAAAVGLLLSLLLLCGCQMADMQAEQQEVTLPSPQRTQMELPNADTVPVRQVEAELYMASADGAMLIPVAHRLTVDYTQEAALALMEALISADEAGMVNPIPEGTRVLNVEHSGKLVTVDLSIDAYGATSDREMLMMDVAIARTLCSLEDVDVVNLLIGGRKYSLQGMSMGALDAESADLTLLWAKAGMEADMTGEYEMNRTAILYYPASSGEGVLPAAVQLNYRKDCALDALLAQLAAVPEGMDGVRAAFAQTPEYAAGTVVTEDGRRVIRLDLSADTWAMMQSEAADLSCEAIALTLVSFLPEVDGVVFCADGMLITQYEMEGDTLRPDTGVLTREMLRGTIGDAVEMYYAAEEGEGLKRVTKVLSPMVRHYPRMLLSMLMEGPAAADGALSAFPEGVGIGDVLAISLREDVLEVNLSANFYRLCQTLDEGAERRLVYSMVNTLCGLEGVSAVQFYVEGAQADVLSESICICVPLMPAVCMAVQQSDIPMEEMEE